MLITVRVTASCREKFLARAYLLKVVQDYLVPEEAIAEMLVKLREAISESAKRPDLAEQSKGVTPVFVYLDWHFNIA